MKISEKITYLRKAKGWSQEQLATKLDVSRQAVYKWEADINQPDLDKLKKLAAVFNISYDLLMDDSINLPLEPNIVEVEDAPEVEVIESKPTPADSKIVNNEVAVQINYGKPAKEASKKPIIILSAIIGVVVVALCSILFGVILQKESYLIKFETDGGTAIVDQIIKEGKVVNKVNAPTKAGYTFDGWYLGDKKWDFDADKITNNTTLLAKWIPNKNTITYVNDGTTEKHESFANTDQAVSLDKNIFVKAGYTFMGWALTPNGEVEYSDCASFKMGIENVTLYAVWSADAYNLVLNLNGSTLSEDVPKVFTTNDSIVLPTPVLEFYTFEGWYTSDNKKLEIVPRGTTSDIVLTAKFIPINYNIQYELDGGTNNESNPSTYTAITSTTFFDPTRNGYVFSGWYSDKDFTEKITSTAIGKSGSITIYAKWLKIINISYELDNGINSSLNPNVILENEEIELKAPSKEGYFFVGWYIDNIFTESIEKISGSIKKDVTVYAKYLKIINIKYELNGGINNKDNPEFILENQTHTLKDPASSLDNYVFDGWYSDSSFTNKVTEIKGSDLKDITVYAKFVQQVKFTFTNNSQGGYTLTSCEGFGVIEIPSIYNGKNVTEIAPGAFSGQTEITEIKIPATVSKIDVTAFNDCTSLEKFGVASQNTAYASLNGIIYNPAYTVIFKYPMGKKDKVYHAPKTLDVVQSNAFYGCLYLEQVNLPNDSTGIDGVGKIGISAFENCTALKNIELGYLANYFEDRCFMGCTSLQSVVFKHSNLALRQSAFENCRSLSTVTFLGGSYAINDRAFLGCTSLYDVKLGRATALGSLVFANTALKAITIPASVTSMGSAIFFNCSNLTVTCEVASKPSGWASDWSTGAAKVNWKIDYDESISEFMYTEYDNYVVITGYIGVLGEPVFVPDYINGKPVTGISQGAFSYRSGISSINIPSTVTNIDMKTFDNCSNLAEINVDSLNTAYASRNGVLYNKNYTCLYKYPMGKQSISFTADKELDVIGEGAFKDNIHLRKLYLYEDTTLVYGVGKIYPSAFENCTNLSTVFLGYLTNYFDTACFKNCHSITNLEFNCSKITGIQTSAFEGCSSLQGVTFAGTVDYINSDAFNGCVNLSSVDLGQTKQIYSYAFANTALKEIFIPSTVNTIAGYAFAGNESLVAYCEPLSKPSGWSDEWSEGVSQIYWNRVGLSDQARYTYNVYGDGLSILSCEGAGVIMLPSFGSDNKRITRIEANAFNGQTEITEIIIPVSITSIDAHAFDNCPSLEKITYLGTYTEFCSADGVLYGDFGKSILKYPEGKKDTEFEIPYNVDNVRAYAFKNNAYLKKVTFPGDVAGDNYVGALWYGAFSGCTSLTTVENCYVNYLDKEVFKGCTALKEITLYNDISHIMNQAFLNCSNLEKVTFKGNVGDTGWQVFGYCTKLKNVNFEGTLGSIGWGLLEGCLSLNRITIPNGPTTVSGEAFKNCQSLVSVVIPSSVTAISKNAFIGTSLMYVNIPATVTTIEDYAFAGIYDLFIFCEATEKPAGWVEKWNYQGELETSVPYKTYWGETYIEPTFEYKTVSGGNTHIEEIRNIQSKILILPSMNGTSRITHLSLFETDLYGVEEIFISNWIGSTGYNVTMDLTSDLKSIMVAHYNQNYSAVDGVLYNKDKTELIYYPRSKENSEYVAIEGLKTIKAGSFGGSKNLTSLVLYNDEKGYGVTKVENDSFPSCPKLSSIYFGKSITDIGSEAFVRCNELTSLEFINENPLKIGAYTFYSCEKLESVFFKGASTTIETYAFNLCENISTLDLTGVVSIGHCGFSAGAKLKEVFIPKTVVTMDSRAFDYPAVITFYCQPSERPEGWDEGWVGKTAFVTILWGQSGLPTN